MRRRKEIFDKFKNNFSPNSVTAQQFNGQMAISK
jgi:hypothetical protein